MQMLADAQKLTHMHLGIRTDKAQPLSNYTHLHTYQYADTCMHTQRHTNTNSSSLHALPFSTQTHNEHTVHTQTHTDTHTDTHNADFHLHPHAGRYTTTCPRGPKLSHLLRASRSLAKTGFFWGGFWVFFSIFFRVQFLHRF